MVRDAAEHDVARAHVVRGDHPAIAEVDRPSSRRARPRSPSRDRAPAPGCSRRPRPTRPPARRSRELMSSSRARAASRRIGNLPRRGAPVWYSVAVGLLARARLARLAPLAAGLPLVSARAAGARASLSRPSSRPPASIRADPTPTTTCGGSRTRWSASRASSTSIPYLAFPDGGRPIWPPLFDFTLAALARALAGTAIRRAARAAADVGLAAASARPPCSRCSCSRGASGARARRGSPRCCSRCSRPISCTRGWASSTTTAAVALAVTLLFAAGLTRLRPAGGRRGPARRRAPAGRCAGLRAAAVAGLSARGGDGRCGAAGVHRHARAAPRKRWRSPAAARSPTPSRCWRWRPSPGATSGSAGGASRPSCCRASSRSCSRRARRASVCWGRSSRASASRTALARRALAALAAGRRRARARPRGGAGARLRRGRCLGMARQARGVPGERRRIPAAASAARRASRRKPRSGSSRACCTRRPCCCWCSRSARAAARTPRPRLFLAAWTAVWLVAALVQRRFVNELSVPFALLVAVCAADAARAARRAARGPRAARRRGARLARLAAGWLLAPISVFLCALPRERSPRAARRAGAALGLAARAARAHAPRALARRALSADGRLLGRLGSAPSTACWPPGATATCCATSRSVRWCRTTSATTWASGASRWRRPISRSRARRRRCGSRSSCARATWSCAAAARATRTATRRAACSRACTSSGAPKAASARRRRAAGSTSPRSRTTA